MSPTFLDFPWVFRSRQVVLLREAYRGRLAKLQEQAAVMLQPRRARLAQLGSAVRRRIEDVSGARAAVERETVLDGEAVLERLRAAEGLKLATLAQVGAG
jgi:hypothetical protein